MRERNSIAGAALTARALPSAAFIQCLWGNYHASPLFPNMIEETVMTRKPLHAADAPGDSSRLMVLVVVITAGALVVVGALLAAAAIGTPWALAAVVAVHLVTTAVVFVVVVYVIFGRVPLPQRHGRGLRARRSQ
jgi:hypothetical protein